MLCCPVCSHLSLARTAAILSMVTWEDGSKFLQLPSPFSHKRKPGPPSSLMSESGSWGGSPCPAFQAAAISPPSNPTCTALLPSCGTQSSLDWHWPPQSWASFTAQPAPREEPPALVLDHSVTRFAFYTYSPFLSTVPSLLWRKSKPHFLCVFLSDPLFSSNPQSSCWDQVPKPMECHSHQPAGSLEQTPLSPHSLLSSHWASPAGPHYGVCMPVVSEHHSLRLVEIFLPWSSSATQSIQRYREQPFLASHTPCDIRKCGYLLLQTSSMSQRPKTIRVYFLLTS